MMITICKKKQFFTFIPKFLLFVHDDPKFIYPNISFYRILEMLFLINVSFEI